MKFLIVDDDVIFRMVLSSILKPYGDIQEASSAEEALKILQNVPNAHQLFQAIFLDISMPGMSGIDCLRTIRKYEFENGISVGEGFKVLMVTSDSDNQTIIGSFSEQCDGYIVKPFDEAVVLNALRMADILT